MAKVKPYEINKKEKNQVINDLFDSIDKLKTKKEIVKFFLGLFTSSEALMLARRIQIAQLLLEGESYDYIMRKLKVSSHTIHRTDQWLHRGKELDVKWLHSIVKKEKKRNEIKKRRYSGSMLDRYAFHRFWSDLFQ